jgi:hypothetical protein
MNVNDSETCVGEDAGIRGARSLTARSVMGGSLAAGPTRKMVSMCLSSTKVWRPQHVRPRRPASD